LPRRRKHGRRNWKLEMLMHELSDVWQIIKFEFLRINKCWTSTLISSTWKIPEHLVVTRTLCNKVWCKKLVKQCIKDLGNRNGRVHASLAKGYYI
jgi:hypothetical protein